MRRRRSEAIINAGLVGCGTNLLEGTNNTVKVFTRVSYRFDDIYHFILKLKASFPKKLLRQLKLQSHN